MTSDWGPEDQGWGRTGWGGVRKGEEEEDRAESVSQPGVRHVHQLMRNIPRGTHTKEKNHKKIDLRCKNELL